VISAVFKAPDGLVRSSVVLGDIGGLKDSHGGLLWVHIQGNGRDERHLLGDVLGFHHLAVDDCFNGRVDTPKIDDYRDHLFMISQAAAFQGPDMRLDIREVAIFLGRTFVVTVTEEPVEPVEEIFQRANETGAFLDRGADFLAHTILDSLVDLLLPAVEDLHDILDDLERGMLESPTKRHLAELLALKRNALRLRRSILPSRDLVNRLSREEFPNLIRPEALIFYRDVYDHIVRVEELIETLRDVSDSALNTYMSAVNNRMNEVMKTLSIVAAIFLPLTLIASIYGTNLDYSPFGVNFEAGFFLMLGLMLGIAGGMVLYFRLRGWF
jgi:magnesium transporter